MKSQSRNVYLNLGMAQGAKKPQRLGDQTTPRTQEQQRFRAQDISQLPAKMNLTHVK